MFWLDYLNFLCFVFWRIRENTDFVLWYFFNWMNWKRGEKEEFSGYLVGVYLVIVCTLSRLRTVGGFEGVGIKDGMGILVYMTTSYTCIYFQDVFSRHRQRFSCRLWFIHTIVFVLWFSCCCFFFCIYLFIILSLAEKGQNYYH